MEKIPQLDSGIEVHPDGGITCTGDGVKTYANILLYNSLVLECKTNLRMSRYGSAAQVVKRNHGWKGNKYTLLQKLATRYIEQGYIAKDVHCANLATLHARGKITLEQYQKWVKEVNW